VVAVPPVLLGPALAPPARTLAVYGSSWGAVCAAAYGAAAVRAARAVAAIGEKPLLRKDLNTKIISLGDRSIVVGGYLLAAARG
jgi:hypothetical protein